MPAQTILAQGAMFDIVVNDGVARCTIVNRPEIAPEEGAAAAKQMHEILARDVLTAGSRYSGLVFDVRRAPDVFGPKTRAELEKLFRQAEQAKKPIAVRIGTAAIQRLQFTSLCSECSPVMARVVDSDADEEWARAQPATGRRRG